MRPSETPRHSSSHSFSRYLRRARRGAGLLVLALAAACSPADAPGPVEETAGEPNWPAAWAYSQDVEAVEAAHAMVVTTDRYASEVGRQILRDGGNAVDAAVAVTFTLAVVNPEAGNIGGGGFMVLRTADGEVRALDYREKAPLAATRDMFLDEEGRVTDASVRGHLAAGVPGTVMGMWTAHQRHGSLPWERLLRPAIELAKGFEVTDRFTRSQTPEIVAALRRDDASAEAFLKDGRPYAVGDTLRQPELQATLERIRDEGPDGFYAGRTADLIVGEMEEGDGLITHEDLRRYRAQWREAVDFEYRGYTVLSMPPSSSAGATLAEAANILETFETRGLEWHSAEHVHLFAEAFRRAYADRNHYLADPDFVDSPLDVLTSDAYAAFRAGTIRPDRATPSDSVGPGVEAFLAADESGGAEGAAAEGTSTTHFSIVDSAGAAVAVTTTINSWYGSKVTVEGAGFLLNNEMDDFSTKPGTPNQFGLTQGTRNAIEPGKRMLSSMGPTIVVDPDGALFMVTGTPGGGTIITTIWQTISNVVDHGMDVARAVVAPRIHHQHLPDRIFYEADGLPEEVVARLRALGHTVAERGGTSGDAQVILVHPDGRLSAKSDPRLGGVALGW